MKKFVASLLWLLFALAGAVNTSADGSEMTVDMFRWFRYGLVHAAQIVNDASELRIKKYTISHP